MNRQTAEAAITEAHSAELAKLYCDEAEHQDGSEYWQNFRTIDELLEDVELFRAALEDDSAKVSS